MDPNTIFDCLPLFISLIIVLYRSICPQNEGHHGPSALLVTHDIYRQKFAYCRNSANVLSSRNFWKVSQCPKTAFKPKSLSTKQKQEGMFFNDKLLLNFVQFFTLFFLGIASIGPTLWGTFLFDDGEAVVNNDLVTRHDQPVWPIFTHDFWGVKLSHPESHKSYRPLTTLTYRLDHYFWGLNPFPFHAETAIIHGINCGLVYFFLKRVLGKSKSKMKNNGVEQLSFWSAVIFAVHPVHVEPLGGVVGRADILSSFVFLLGFLLIPDRRIGCGRAIFVASLSIFASLFKENAIVLSVFHIVHDFAMRRRFRTHKKLLFEYFLTLLLINCFISLRLWFQDGRPVFQEYDNPPAFAKDLFTRTVNIVYVWGLNCFILLNPIWLCYDWSGGCIQLIQSLWDFRILFVMAFLRTWPMIFRKALKNQVVLAACIVSLITFLPASNILISVGFTLAERNLYLPSIGFALMTTYSMTIVTMLNSYYRKLLLAFVTFIWFSRSIQRSYEWGNQPALFISGNDVCPNNAKVHYNIGTMYAEAGEVTSSEIAYKTAISLRPSYYQAMNNLGNLLRNKNLTEAEYWLREAVKLNPAFPPSWMNLGVVLSKQNQTESLLCYKNALRLRKNYLNCQYNLGNLYLDMGDKKHALEAWKNATLIKPSHAQSWINIVILLEEEGKEEKAKKAALKALEHIPEHDTLHFLLGNILGSLSEFTQAEIRFKTAIKLCKRIGKPIPLKYYINLGVLYHRWGKKELAAKVYKKALDIDPSSETVKKNIKLLKIDA